ncbi:MAG: hypothetical protein E2O29_01490 [Deltaproteobacteria bacterium]|nr:MAG: hypothetical protein E2O29_01490 [Deltaproteobacteria bacterium]
MKPKWLTKKESERKKSDKRVAKVAKNTGGFVTPNSGATAFKKGDIQYSDVLLEHKLTAKESFKLNKELLIKTYKDGIKEGKDPWIMVDFGSYSLTGLVKKHK